MDSKSFITPKRDRLWHQQRNNTSPLSSSSSRTGAKRRKLNTGGSSVLTSVADGMPAGGGSGRPVKAFHALKSAIGGVFGLGKARENMSVHETLETNVLQSKSLSREPNYPDELSRGDGKDDQILDAAVRANTPLAESTRLDKLGNDEVWSPTSKRKTKKSRALDIDTDARTEGDDELTVAPKQMMEKIPPNMARTDHVFEGRTGMSRDQSNKLLNANIAEKGRTSLANMGLEGDLLPGGASRSSRRERKRPRRYSTEMAADIQRPSIGTVTPTEKLRGRPRKSVVLEDDSVKFDHGPGIPNADAYHSELEMLAIPKKRGRPRKIVSPDTPAVEAVKADLNGFKGKKAPEDDKSTRTSELSRKNISLKKLKASGEKQAFISKLPRPENAVQADEDDTKCIICKGGESEYPNEILLCDSCDLAAHQVCYGIGKIPKGDWLCRDCRPEEDEELSLLETGTHSEPALDILSSKAPEIEGVEYHLQVMQKLILDKLTGRRQFKLYDLDEEYRKVHQIVEQTVLAGEGNSMLVIGARGCGKTTLVESVLSNISKDHRQDFHIVRLSGFIHTDDKLALREIWRQLGREMEVEDEVVSKTNNYADTLASLLALLSHPSEVSGVKADHVAKAVIFVLDEFDLFASHPRQTLLYNLFDIAQARKAPIAVLGLTTKIDVVERLEKRVKSRFSHRYVHLPLPRSLAAYWEICRQGLLVDEKELVEGGFNQGLIGQDEFFSFWESMVNDLYNKDSSFKHHLQMLYYRSKSVPSFLTTCILPVANLVPSNLPLRGSSFVPSTGSIGLPSLQPPDSKLHLLPSLADVDLALLIAGARLNVILDTENCNFSMAYDEYCSLTSKHKIQAAGSGSAALGVATKVWGREVALGAWERLAEYELLVPAGVGVLTAGRDTTGREVRMWRVDVGLEEIPGGVELVGVMGKWCREI